MRTRIPDLLVVAALLVVTFLVDLLTPPELPLAALYAIPLLVAAQRLSPRAVVAISAAGLLLFLVNMAIDQMPLAALSLRWLILVVVAYLGYLLSVRIREAQLARSSLQNFLGMVAHDLRGPLTSILGYAGLLARTQVAPEMRERAVGTIQSEARRMERLVADLVDAACAGAGSFQVQPQSMDLAALARQVAEAQQAAAPGHSIAVEASERMEGRWDPDRLAQVLNNLVGNAIKYSPGGGGVRIRVERQEGRAAISISDQGPGLRPDDLRQLFQPFSRLDTTRDTPGAGLGLYITWAIVHAHGGRIWATSPGPGKGCTFTFTLPARQ